MISLVTMVKNEEKNLPKMFQSVEGLVHEKIVVDTGSTDGTIELCKDHGCKVIENLQDWHIDIFAENKNLALSHATGDWVLCLDADEELSEELNNEIRNFLQLDHDALRVRRIHFYRKQKCTKDKLIKFFKREKYFFKTFNGCHEHPVIDEKGNLGNFKNSQYPLYHWGWMNMTKENFLLKKEIYGKGEYEGHFKIMEEQFGLIK